MNRPTRVARWVALGVGALYALILAVSGVHLTSVYAKILGYAPTGVVVIVIAFDLLVWRWPVVNRFVGRPVLRGAWLGTLQPHLNSMIPPGGNRGPIDIAVVIEQTYWSVVVGLFTAESSSHSTTAAIRSHNGSAQQRILTYAYENSPQQQFRSRSHPHTGATQFAVTGRAPNKLTGTYWTDRLTVGDIEITRVSKQVDVGSLADVQALLGRP